MLIGVQLGGPLESQGGHGEVLLHEHIPALLKLLVQLGVGGLIAPSLSSLGGAQGDGRHDAGVPSSEALGTGTTDIDGVLPDLVVVDVHRDLVTPNGDEVAVEAPLLVGLGLDGFSRPSQVLELDYGIFDGFAVEGNDSFDGASLSQGFRRLNQSRKGQHEATGQKEFPMLSHGNLQGRLLGAGVRPVWNRGRSIGNRTKDKETGLRPIIRQGTSHGYPFLSCRGSGPACIDAETGPLVSQRME